MRAGGQEGQRGPDEESDIVGTGYTGIASPVGKGSFGDPLLYDRVHAPK